MTVGNLLQIYLPEIENVVTSFSAEKSVKMFWLNTFGIFIAILNALDSKFQFQGVVIQVQVPKCEKEFQQWLETMDSICFWVIVLNSVVENRSNAFARSRSFQSSIQWTPH